jgi:hypothetical protein
MLQSPQQGPSVGKIFFCYWRLNLNKTLLNSYNFHRLLFLLLVKKPFGTLFTTIEISDTLIVKMWAIWRLKFWLWLGFLNLGLLVDSTLLRRLIAPI